MIGVIESNLGCASKSPVITGRPKPDGETAFDVGFWDVEVAGAVPGLQMFELC